MNRFNQYSTNSSNSLRAFRLRATSSLIGQPLARRAFDGNRGALHVVNAKLGASILPEIELGQVAVKMLGIDVLINADDAPLEDRKEAFKGVGMHVAARPFKLGMVNRAVAGRARELEDRGAVRHQSALAVELAIEQAADAAMVNNHGADRAAAFDKAENLHVALAATGTAARLGRLAQFHIVGFHRLSLATNPAAFVGVHHFADAMPKVPSGFHAATKHPLKLARRHAFLARTKHVDGLEPQPQRKVAILKNRALAHRKLATAVVAFAQSGLLDTFRMLFARLRAHAFELADVVGAAAMRADRTIRPQHRFDVLKSGLFAMKRQIGKDGLGHGYLQ
jgi:hypothetical protein